MPQTKLFKENTLAAGIKSPNDIIEFEFELNEGVTGDQIDQIATSCGVCTKAWYDQDVNKIIGTLDVSKAQGQYNMGQTPINKTIIVYLNDGRRRFIGKEGTKESIADPKKEMERLNIACVVQKN